MISFEMYVLDECRRQWAECQEELYGAWDEQSTEEQRDYFDSMYRHLWQDRFGADDVIIPAEEEEKPWDLLQKELAGGKRSCMNCLHNSGCLKRGTAIFMLYIQTERYSEAEIAKERLDISSGCHDWMKKDVEK
jgi:hypothetical protein